jgi:hypothetical protein
MVPRRDAWFASGPPIGASIAASTRTMSLSRFTSNTSSPGSTMATTILQTWPGAANTAISPRDRTYRADSGRKLSRFSIPRHQRWNRHFRWDGPLLVGSTKCGKATIRVLDMNNKDRCRMREILIALGAFPPP